jgi:hypothetical protein
MMFETAKYIDILYSSFLSGKNNNYRLTSTYTTTKTLSYMDYTGGGINSKWAYIPDSDKVIKGLFIGDYNRLSGLDSIALAQGYWPYKYAMSTYTKIVER